MIRAAASRLAEWRRRKVRGDDADSPQRGAPRFYQIGAVPLEFRTDSLSLRRAFDWAYRPYRAVALPERRVHLAARRFGPFWSRDRHYRVYSGGRQHATFRRAADCGPYLDWAANWDLALTMHQFLIVHAAVVARNGRAALLAGPPESGKSTLAAGLLLSGWQYLCDEFALLDPAAPRVFPYPKSLSLKKGTLELLTAAGLRLPPVRRCYVPNYDEVAVMPAHRVRPGAVGGECPVGLVVFPHVVSGAAPKLVPVSPADALLRLNRSCFNFMEYRARGIEILERVVTAADCYEMQVGSLSESMPLVESALDRSASRDARRASA